MEWFSQNWVWVLFFIGMVAMHMGHGGHGGHKDPRAESKDGVQRTLEKEPDHTH